MRCYKRNVAQIGWDIFTLNYAPYLGLANVCIHRINEMQWLNLNSKVHKWRWFSVCLLLRPTNKRNLLNTIQFPLGFFSFYSLIFISFLFHSVPFRCLFKVIENTQDTYSMCFLFVFHLKGNSSISFHFSKTLSFFFHLSWNGSPPENV